MGVKKVIRSSQSIHQISLIALLSLSLLILSFRCYEMLDFFSANPSKTALIVPRQSPGSPFLGSSFTRMGLHASTVFNGTLYIDGGEVSWHADSSNTSFTEVPNNSTLSIDLSQSWSPLTVNIDTIGKPNNAPTLNYAALWAAEDSFYSWAGHVSFALLNAAGRDPQNSIWQFKNGEWLPVPTGSGFSNLSRPASGNSAYGNGMGYYLGGYDSEAYLSISDNPTPLPGLITYNMSTNTWANTSSTGYSPGRISFFGGMEYVPIFGQDGLLLVFGGDQSNATSWDQSAENEQSFSKINIYDPTTGNWYEQQTTGNIPPAAELFCKIGTQSNQGTYEIFMYGGHNDAYMNPVATANSSAQAQQSQFNQVYILSLPGFVWFKSNDSSAEARTAHTCELIGNRQMISIGGLNPSKSQRVNFAVSGVDSNPQGLGIFDMVDLKWTNTYDANAAAYEVPNVVREWYSNPASTSSVQWSSTQLESLFAIQSSANPPTTSPAPSSAPTASATNTGAIVGGIVGGIACLSLLSVLAWVLVRRHRRNRYRAFREATTEPRSHFKAEMPCSSPVKQMLDSRMLRQELGDAQLLELEALYHVRDRGPEELSSN